MVASAMLTGERRGVSTRRGGMTVLGKVPKPINLPSQRLENRGLDPNVEIVPKGTVSWGNAGCSPPTSGNAWGAAAISSSPPPNAGPWNNRLNVSTTRPSSGGSGTRPSTAGSDHSHEPGTPNAWGSTSSRPSSASGVLGLAHSQSSMTRPCSAESRPGSSQLSRFAESSVESGGPWGGYGSIHKLGEGRPHPQFSLTSVDFPTLGSDKNPNLRPQHGNPSTIRSSTTSEGLAQKEITQPSSQDWCDDESTGSSANKDQRSGDTWKMGSPPYGGEMRVLDDRNPQNEGFQRQTFVQSKDSWHYDDGHRNPTPSNPTVDEWPRGGPPVGPYGPSGGQGRFPFNSSGYIRPAFDYGPVPYPQRPHGPGGYRHGEMYGPYVGQPMVAGRPSVPLGHSMYPNHLAFDGYYGPQGVPGSHYGNMDERGEMTMMRMGGGPGMYSGYQRHGDGPKFQYNGPGAGPRPVFHSSISRDQKDSSAYSRAASEGTDKANVQQADIWMSKDANTSSGNNRPIVAQHSNVRTSTKNPQSEFDDLGSIPSSHRDWGTASSDEQMDFSKPVFGEEALSSQGLAENSSGMESNYEKSANITMKAEQRSVSDKNKTQYQTKEGLVHTVEVDGSSKMEKKNLTALVDEKVPENVKFEELENQAIEVYSTREISKGLVSTTSSERHEALNTSLKLKGGLSSAAGLNNSSHETPKVKDRVQLLKRRENRPTDNSVDTEETMEQVHSTQGTKGIQEPLQRDSHTMKGKLSAHEGDSEWRRKMPKAESASKVAKNNISNVDHFNSQILASSVPDGAKTSSEDFGDQLIGESQGQAPAGSRDFEAQRARMKEIAAQRAKQLQREEEERTKEQKAKALAKLEELNRRALVCSTSQNVGKSKSQSETCTPSGSVSSEPFQLKKEGSFENNSLIIGHPGIDKPETPPQDNFVEVKHNRREDNKVKLGEQTDILKGAESIPTNDVLCEIPSTVVLDESPGNIGKNVSASPAKSGKNEKAKRKNARRPINVNMEDSKSYMKMDDQKSLPKERESPSYIDSRQDRMRDALVSASRQTSLSTFESLQKDVSLTESDSSWASDQLYNPELTKQNRNCQKAKQYVLEKKASSSQLSTLEKTEQVTSIDTSHSANPAGENDMLQESSNTTAERISETRASSSDCIPVSRKLKTNRSTKSKHKNDRPTVTCCSETLEQDDSMVMQSNRVDVDLKQESVVVSGNSIEFVDKYVDIQNRKSEVSSVGNGGNDVNMARDTPAVDRGLLQSTEDITNGRVPQVKSHFSKRTYRGSQDGRADKSHGSEGMVWAPVRSVNHQVSANDRQKLDQIGGETQQAGSTSSEVPLQNPVRNRRAELERYVPKPVAKEQAQYQENRQHHAAGSFGSARDQMDHPINQQGTANDAVSGEVRHKNLSTGESKGHTVGIKQGKPNASWRQRNSNEIRQNKVSQCIEVEATCSLQTNEVTVSKARQGHLQTQDIKSEDIANRPQLQQPESHKARQLEQLPKSVRAQGNRQQSFHSEADQATQTAPTHHLLTSDAAKDQAAELSSKREQNERFYQANKSRQKLHKVPVRQAYMEGNHQITKIGLIGESEKNYSEQIISHQRPRSSGSWTPKQQGLADRNEHPMQKIIYLGETEIHDGNMDLCEEKHNFHNQPVQQSALPSDIRALSDQQEGVQSSAKQQHTQDQYFGQISGSPHQSEGKNQGPNRRQPASTSYQHRRQSGHGHWQQAGSNAQSGSRRTESHEEHPWPAVMQNHGRQDTRPSTPESSFGAGQNNKQDMIKQQVSTNSDPIKQNVPIHSYPISNQKPQELYQPKSASASWTGDKNGINHGTASHGGPFWSGEHRSSHVYRDRDHNHARRGRTSGRGGRGFGVGGHEAESKTEHPSKNRMLVDATGGAVPHQVAG